ncbi:MAG: winged helix-turn-helix domain-containing protein [Thaumarchaeota archaeon]|jgi:DNA-binding Lrp family transcriptional regulator|nr:winged helix-turn-helix domain-containing protein [Nitrososphaerota archaeon]MDG6927115.1 winged helix-turn-helix transcriptional regulator [Nitrososphaerota archaeon]MDG6932055.1 winged helix-turn-helix transcriptional regulator [Nitrososphaerota archaeon]
MKKIMMLDDKRHKLLLDPINQSILKELVFNEYSVTDLSRKLKLPTVKLWRRIVKLSESGIIELVKSENVKNMQKKFYRAAALSYQPAKPMSFEPKDQTLKEALKLYVEIQQAIIANIMSPNEVPASVKNIVDYSIYNTLDSFCRVMLDKSTLEKMRQIKYDLEKSSKYGNQIF